MPFTKKHTNIAKGIAIIMLILHHGLAYPERLEGYGIVFPLLGYDKAYTLGQVCKMTVFVFVFLTAFGIAKATKKLRDSRLGTEEINRQMRRYSFKRYISIMAGFLIIYIISVAALSFTKEPPAATYSTGALGVVYIFFDLTGLSFLMNTPTLNPTWWYMGIAVIIPFTMPAFLRWFKRDGALSVIVCLLLTNIVYLINREGVGHLLALPIGIACAEWDVFARVNTLRPFKKEGRGTAFLNQTLLIIVAAAWCGFFMLFSVSWVNFYFGYMLATPALIYICYALLGRIPVISHALEFLGRHSMNIFLTHTFVQERMTDWLYSLKYAPLIVLALLLIPLAFSVVLELLKKLCGYNRLVQRLEAPFTINA